MTAKHVAETVRDYKEAKEEADTGMSEKGLGRRRDIDFAAGRSADWAFKSEIRRQSRSA